MKALLRCGSAPSSGSSLLRGQRQRRAARPAPDELGGQQLLLGAARGALAQVLAARRPRACAACGRRRRCRCGRAPRAVASGATVAGLVRVAQDELAGLERRLVRVAARDAAALDRRLADPVLEAERFALVRQRRRRPAARSGTTPGDRAGRRGRGRARASEPRSSRRERDQRDVDVGRAERRLPVLGRVLADVAQVGRPCRHALLELGREAGQRRRRHARAPRGPGS